MTLSQEDASTDETTGIRCVGGLAIPTASSLTTPVKLPCSMVPTFKGLAAQMGF